MKLGSCNTILQGDIRQIARTLQAQSVHCIVTSPPYYGLRDYGTAEWQGGKADCDHSYQIKSPLNEGFNERWGNAPGDKKQESWRHERQYQKTCPKCGAIRKDAQIGLEASPQEYIETLVGIFRELRRVLRDDGTVWLNLGDSYASGNRGPNEGHTPTVGAHKMGKEAYAKQANRMLDKSCGLKPKDLIGIPWRVALALQADGWYLRSDIIWSKSNPMPESVKDRPTKAHEYIFLLSKSPRYYYDQDAIREPHNPDGRKVTTVIAGNGSIQYRNGERWPGDGRNKRTVWEVSTKPYPEAHFAVFPPDLIRPCILAGCPPGGIVLDPFMGSGTVAQVAIEEGRQWLGVELNPDYIDLAWERIGAAQPALLAAQGNGVVLIKQAQQLSLLQRESDDQLG